MTARKIVLFLMALPICQSHNLTEALGYRYRRQTETGDLTAIGEECRFNLQSTRQESSSTNNNNSPDNATEDGNGNGNDSKLACGVWNLTGSAWQESEANEAFFRGGPPVDANGDDKGGYLLLDIFVSNADETTASNRIISSVFPPTKATGVCFTFSFSLNGLGAGGLRILLIENFKTNSTEIIQRVLWESYDVAESTEWKRGSVSFTSALPYQIEIEGLSPDFSYTPSDYRGYAAIDNTQFFNGFCRGDCNFDIDTCAWTNSVDDDFNWSLGWGSLSSNTGPLGDRSNSGGYLYINSNFPRRAGDRAKLISPVFSSSEVFCMRFWVSEFGSGIGGISVWIHPAEPAKSNPEDILAWNVRDPLGGGFARDVWQPSQVSVSYLTRYQVIIEATVGRPSRGNIAVDDVSFQRGSCAPIPMIANNRPGDCAFIDGRCSWKIERVQQPIGSPDLWCNGIGFWIQVLSNPYKEIKELTQDGYMRFETNFFQHQPLDHSRLLSPMFPPTNETLCLSFWVYISAPITTRNGLGSLQVLLLKSHGTTDLSRVIWRLENHQRSQWIYSQVPVMSAERFQIAFEGIRGAQVLGLLAVDDVAFFVAPPAAVAESTTSATSSNRRGRRQADKETESQTTLSPTQPLTPTQPATQPPSQPEEQTAQPTPSPNGNVNGPLIINSCKVLPARAAVLPGDCAFDVDFCGWINIGTDLTKWMIAALTKSPANVNDHTYNIPQGGFIYFDPFTPSGNPTSASLQSPLIAKPENNFCFSFWYNMYGNDKSASLVVSERKHESGPWKEIWKATEVSIAPEWRFAQVSVGEGAEEPFKVMLAATSRVAVIGLDDIRLYDGKNGNHCRKKM